MRDRENALTPPASDRIEVAVDDGLRLFRETGLFSSLSRRGQALADGIVLGFTDAMWVEHGQRRDQWTAPEVRSCCSNTLPRWFPEEARFPDVATAPLVSYLLFLHEYDLHEEAFACACAVFEVAEAMVEARHAASPSFRAGRNDPCPCGSGTKFKRCHGTAAAGSGSRPVDPDVVRPNPYARAAMLDAVRAQLGTGDPPEARAAYERLVARGWPAPEARAALCGVLAGQVFDVLRTRTPSDPSRYAERLRGLG